jgi:hypothetical protein
MGRGEGLDGGTIPSRSDLLRRASWRLNCQDSTRSTRGGQINATNYRFEIKRDKREFKERIQEEEEGRELKREKEKERKG